MLSEGRVSWYFGVGRCQTEGKKYEKPHGGRKDMEEREIPGAVVHVDIT
jgi:hypothetical protein